MTIDIGESTWPDWLGIGANAPVGCAGITIHGAGSGARLGGITAYSGSVPQTVIENLSCEWLTSYNGHITVRDISFTGKEGANVLSVRSGHVFLSGSVAYSGKNACGLYATSGGTIESSANFVFNNPTFTTRCFAIGRGGNLVLTAGSYSGAFTGEKYHAYEGGNLSWAIAGLCPDNLPGTINGWVRADDAYIGAVGTSKGGCGILGSTGALIGASGAVIASTRVSTGTYEVTFSQNIGVRSRGVGSIQVALPGSVSCKRVSATKYAVYVYNATGALADLDCGLNFYW